jgi:L-alanine-DL-glutamate epimerase-like enolase superfamily enzyme
MASQQFTAAHFNSPMMECTRRADEIPWMDPNPLQIRDGYMTVSTRPGLGVELDQEYLKAQRADGEPWWE